MFQKIALSLAVVVGLGSLFLLGKIYWEGFEQRPAPRPPVASPNSKVKADLSSPLNQNFFVVESLPKSEPAAEPPKPLKDQEPLKPAKEPEPSKPVKESEPLKPAKESEPLKPAKEPESLKPAKVPEPLKPAKVAEPLKLTKEPEPRPAPLAPPETKGSLPKGSAPKSESKPEPEKRSVEAKSPDPGPPPEVKKKPNPKKSKKPAVASPPALKEDPADAEAGENIVIIAKSGDNIYSIAARIYHIANTSVVDMILELNPKVTRPNKLLVKQKIQLPVISEESLVIEASDGTCQIRLGTFLKPEYAGFLKGQPVLQGKEIEFKSWKVPDGQVWHRAWIGTFDNQEEALEVVREMKEKGLSPYFPGFKYKE